MIGSLLMAVAFATALISMLAYAVAIRSGEERYLKIGRVGFHTMVVGIIFAAAVLMYLILNHQFQYTYVWSHSSTNLATPFLVASFYSGQEGSFMLWTILTALIGVLVLGYAYRVKYEAEVMSIYMLVMTLLLLILVVKSPFETIYASFPDQNIPAGFIPANGKGLNPTLENIWITIHPPILFTGFAAMTVPFVFALAGLIRKDYQRWISIALPWTLFASMVLGFGIMLGGWWAYETLGWGGFWAWDPVENSSLIPWIVCVALVHTMLVQKKTGASPANGNQKVGALSKTNFALAIAAFGLILYSTFLTRSGILGDTSVHSFVTPGNFVFAVLLGIIIIFVSLGFGTLLWRWRDLRAASLEIQLLSRETALAIGSAALLASSFVVFVGTSWPIFMPLFDKPKVAVPIDFYNTLHLPIALAIVVLNGIAMTLKWKNTTPRDFFRKISTALGIAALGTLGLILLDVTDPIYIALGFGSILALVLNIQIGARVMRGNPRLVGAYVSHAGVSILLLGIIFTARYSVTQHVRLVKDTPTQMFGYTAMYQGYQQIELEKTDREKYKYHIQLEKDGKTYQTAPIIFWSDFNKRETPFMEPGILYSPTKDIYISPKALEQEGGDPTFTLHKGDKAVLPFDSAISIRFEKFDMSRAETERLQGAVIEVSTPDSSMYVTAYRTMDGKTLPASIPGTDITVGMVGLNADRENLSNSEAIIAVRSASHPTPPATPVIAVDVSIKPFISFVWAGVIIMVGGFFFSIIRRRKEIRLLLPRNNDTGTGTSTAAETPKSAQQPVPETQQEKPHEIPDEQIAARGAFRT